MPAPNLDPLEEAQHQLTRAESDLAAVELFWRRIPWLGLTGLLLIPATILWGVVGFVLTLSCVVITLGTAAYMTYVRIWEFRKNVRFYAHRVQVLSASPPG